MSVNFAFKDFYNINDLLKIMEILRAPGGCVWDAEQTHESIKNNMLEEAYETVDAINCNNPKMLCEELGDVLLQVVFHSKISEENGNFNFNSVADGICKKLIYRHSHVFSNVKVSSSEEVLKNWDELKQKEKSQSTYTETLKSVPAAFPALMRAQKVQKRAAKAGLDFENVSQIYSKTEEELSEVKTAVEQNSNIKEELGDLLFSCVNIVRALGYDAEECLNLSTEKFISRFERVEQKAEENLKDLSFKQLDKIWESIK